jgi:O-antigen ligase
MNIVFFLIVFFWLLQISFINNTSIETNIIYLKKYLWILLIICILESVYGLAQYWQIVPFQERMVYKTVIIGTIGNTNSVGGFLAAGIPLFIGLHYLCKAKIQKIVVILGIMLTFYVLVLTKSRGAWFALIIGLAIYYWPISIIAWKRIKNIFFRIIIILLVIGMLFLILFSLYSINKSSILGRIFIWKVTMQIVNEHPIFGVGYGNFSVKYLDYQSKFFENPDNSIYLDHAANVKQAHNEYLHVLAETGFVGLVLFILILVTFYRICYCLIHFYKNSDIQKIGRILMASTTIILIHSFFDCPLHGLHICMIFIFNLASISAIAKKISITTGQAAKHLIIDIKTIHLKFRYKFIYIVLIIVLFLIGIWKSFRNIQEAKGYILWKNGMEYTLHENWENGIQHYRKALHYLPHKGELHFHLGGAYVMNKQYKLALPEFKKASLSFNDKNIYLTEGMAYQGLKDYESAERSYSKAISMQPNLLFPQFLLGSMYNESNQQEKAIPILKNILSSIPKIQNHDTKVIRIAAGNLLDSIKKKQ